MSLLEALYLVTLLPAWSTSLTTRQKRHPKAIVIDTGLAADFTEVYKQTTWSEHSVDLAYFRDRNGAEVDLVAEDRRAGQVAGLEIKLTATPSTRHARHLAMFRDKLGERFTVGLVVHAGTYTLPLGDRLWAVPVSALWRCDR